MAAANAGRSLKAAASLAQREFEKSDASHYIDDLEQDAERTEALQTAEYFSAIGTSRAATYAASAAADNAGAPGAASIWAAISEDANSVAETGQFFGLLGTPLWGAEPEWFRTNLHDVEEALSEGAHPYAIWLDWLIRQKDGEAFSFRFPDRNVEAEFDRRLLGKGDSWWSRRDDQVNQDVGTWIRELSGEPAEPADESLRQNSLALTFKRADDGRLALHKPSLHRIRPFSIHRSRSVPTENGQLTGKSFTRRGKPIRCKLTP